MSRGHEQEIGVSAPSVDAVILAGGLGQRLGGVDKGLLPYNATLSFAQALIQVLRPYCRQILVSCNRNEASYQGLADRIVTDMTSEACGPLAGLGAAARASDADFLLLTPCDTPDLDARFPRRMLRELSAATPPRLAHDGERDQLLHLLLPRRLALSVDDYLSRGGRSVKGWLLALTPEVVPFDDCPGMFRNLNTPMELEDWRQGQALRTLD